MLKAPTEAPPRKSVGKPAAKKAPKTPAKMHTPAKRAPKAANPRSATTANATGEHLKGAATFQGSIAPVVFKPKDMAFHVTHKMGVVMTTELIHKHFKGAKIHRSRAPVVFRPTDVHVVRPTVVVIRDMFDAVISGYLYHKSGHECALNWNGNVIPFPRGGNDWARHTAWTRYVTKVPYPNKNTGNLCAALNATNETVGVGIYLEYARNRFFKPIVELRSRNSTLTLFVCYDDIIRHEDETVRIIRLFFNGTLPSRQLKEEERSKYHGGHSTNHDPVLQARLHAIAADIDCTYFDCEMSLIWNNKTIGC